MENKYRGYLEVLDKLHREGRHRVIPDDTTGSGLLDLCDNDYLGLAARWKEFLTEEEGLSTHALSSSASRLLGARQTDHRNLEALLEELYLRPALIFNSGYHINVGIISALNIPGTVFLVDKLIHASVIDGLSMAGATFARWRHNDLRHLEKLLEKYSGSAERMIVVAEAIYSMDGDAVDIPGLIELKKRFASMMIYLDEAHSFGVRGKRGLGMSEETDTMDEIDFIIGTFGKACASSGAFVITTRFMKDYLINSSRSLIFSTALPPLNIYWTQKMLREIIKMERERNKLMEISKDFCNFISEITGKENPSSSHIVPLHIGDATKALRVAERLREKGVRALAIRRPTVPPGGERIRFSLNANLSPLEMEMLKNAVRVVLNEN